MNRIALVLIVIFFTPLGFAGEADALINEVTAVYGGDAVTNMTSIRSHDRFLTVAIGQGHSPARQETNQNHNIVHIDLKNKRFLTEFWGSSRGGSFQGATIFDGEKSTAVDYIQRQWSEAQQTDFYLAAGGSLRTNDTFLVYELNRVRDQVKLLGDERFMGRSHTKLGMPFPGSPDLVLFIDNKTKLISRMLRVNPQAGNLDYIFSGHKTEAGVVSATQITFLIAGAINFVSTTHDVEVNVPMTDELLRVPTDFSAAGERNDGTVEVVNKINDYIYHVGQGGGFSLFVRTSDGLVGAGGYAALTNRLKQYQAESGQHYPLTYQVITHHHTDHIGGVGEAVGLGAKLLTPASNFTAVKENVTDRELKDSDFVAVDSRMTIGAGKNRVELYEVSTAHSDAYLIVYVPTEKLIFIADHMGTPFKRGPAVSNLNLVTMYEALVDLDLDVKRIATAHGPRIFSFKEMVAAASKFDPVTCADDREICI